MNHSNSHPSPPACRALLHLAGVALVLGCLAGGAQGAEGVSGAPGVTASLDDHQALESFFDGAMRVGMDEHHVSAAVVAIVKDGEVVFSKGYGKSDLAKNTPVDPATTLFRIGSTTKTFTWTAVMQLVEAGKIDLDKDVNSYLKGIKIPEAYGKPITMRSIMTHTAGFEEGVLGYLISTDPTHQLSIEEAMKQHMPGRVWSPGDISGYSNYGASLAGLIVEQVSGLPYNDYIKTHIFEPLGMQHASVQEPLPKNLEPDVATGYELENGAEVAQPYEIIGGFRPAGSGAVSALDMTRFMLAHLQDGRLGEQQILKPETAKLMHATAFTLDPRFPGMALGFYHDDINGHDAFGHGGDTELFHTDMILIPGEKFGLFLSFATRDNRVREMVESAFFDRYFPAAPQELERLPDDQARALAARYAGAYQWTRRNHTKIDKLMSLFSSLKVAPVENGNLALSGFGADVLQFEPVGENLYREVLHRDWKLAFGRDANGNDTKLFFNRFPFMPAERTPWYEQGAVWGMMLGVCLLVFLGAIAAAYYRFREIRGMAVAERRAIWLGAFTSAWALATFVAIGGVVAAVGFEGLFHHIPTALSVALIMPMVFVGLTVWLIVRTLGVWRAGWWSIGRRIGFSVYALAAVVLSVFFWQWNLLGWHYG